MSSWKLRGAEPTPLFPGGRFVVAEGPPMEPGEEVWVVDCAPECRSVCECCGRWTLEPIHHGETGDAFCGACAVELLAGEVKLLREALEWARRANWIPTTREVKLAREALALRDE